MAYQLVHFGPGHFGDYLAFARRFRREPGPTAGDLHHKWRIFDNPLGGHLMFAHTDDEIAASLCISGRRLAAPDGPLPGYELGDGWTHERHQRRGLFFRLGGLARELAFADPAAEIIIGAPNPQAVPNWTKHGYAFTRDDGSALVFLPRPLNLAWRLLRGARAGEVRTGAGSRAVAELPFAEYARRSAAFPRMNHGGAVYLEWRFGACPDGYRYFAGEGREGEFLCALRVTRLGAWPVLVVSESFLNGRIDRGTAKLAWLERIASHYRNFAGFHLNTWLAPAPLRYLHMARYRFLVHRPQPLCYLFRGGAPPAPAQRALMDGLRPVFQLSDCDMG